MYTLTRTLFNPRNVRSLTPVVQDLGSSGKSSSQLPLQLLTKPTVTSSATKGLLPLLLSNLMKSSSLTDYPTTYRRPSYQSVVSRYNLFPAQQRRYYSTTSRPPSSSSSRITAPVEGLFDSIPDTAPTSLNAKDSRRTKGDEDIMRTTYGGGDVIERSYNAKKNQFTFMNAFMRHSPSSVDTPVEMRSGKGTPTHVAETLRQMKELGIGYGSLDSAKMSTIQNMKTIVQLHSLMAQGMTADEALRQTHSVQYADTTLTQSGHSITSASLDKKGAWTDKIGSLMKYYEDRETDPNLRSKLKQEHDDLLAQHNVDRDTEMLQNFNIELGLKPFAK